MFLNKKILLAAFLAVFALLVLPQRHAKAQNVFESTVSFDKIVHDFGDVMIADGAQKCTFTLKNISDSPIVVHNVLTSCGCTEPEWTKAPIRTGETGKIDVTFTNDQGPYPFNKSITVYIAGLSKPVILRLKGVAHDKAKSLSELFPIAAGAIGFHDAIVSMGQIEQGLARSIELEIANTSSREVKVSFSDMTPGLKVSIAESRIAAKSKARIVCVVDTKATTGEKWGKTPFTFSILVDGKRYSNPITIEALIKENFTELTEGQKRAAALPQFESSSVDFGKVKAGEKLSTEFVVKNIGRDTLKIYKVDVPDKSINVTLPEDLSLGEKASLKVDVDTKGQSGEQMHILTLITNSPTRPIINLFVIYTVE